MNRSINRLFGRRNKSAKLSRKLLMEALEARLNMALTVPAFSSLPGANHTIYLDFDGHVTTGTSWNSSYGVTSINSPAYSNDADTANFSASELSNIERTYNRVAEDFAPFNVNVTTVAPVVDDLIKSSTSDTKWGVRVVVSKDVAFNCGCGGIAYIDSFNWSSDTPVFVFNTGEVGVAEAASHEVGHSLGLSHDGTSSSSYYQGHGSGATSWSSIMGVGYYVNVSQWDKGEYYGSNNGGSGANYGKGPDDLAIISSYNGFSYKADDHSNTTTGASALPISGTSVSGSGVISQRGDVDMFQFTTGAGLVSLNINPAAIGANLDIQADLLDASGNIVATSNPDTALNASFTNLNLAAGQYFLKIDGVGVGNPTISPPTGYTDYASIGQYTITGSIASSAATSLSIAATSATKPEGNSGTTQYTFTVTRSGDTSVTSTVDWNVTGSGNVPASASDFLNGVLASGSLTFAAGDTSQVLTIDVNGDTTVEGNETFQVNLVNPSSNTSISVTSATGTIQNDDNPPPAPTLAISANDANKYEGTGSTATPFKFTVTRSGDLTNSVSARYTVTGTGSKKAAGTDFVNGFAKNVLVTIPAGAASADIVLNVIADSSKESNETFTVTLSSPVGATITTASASGTIVNDDGVAIVGKLIAVADPLWEFMPAEMLTPEQLAVPIVTWVDGVPMVGEYSHEHDHDHDHAEDSHHDHDHDFAELAGIFAAFAEATGELPASSDISSLGAPLIAQSGSLASWMNYSRPSQAAELAVESLANEASAAATVEELFGQASASNDSGCGASAESAEQSTDLALLAWGDNAESELELAFGHAG